VGIERHDRPASVWNASPTVRELGASVRNAAGEGAQPAPRGPSLPCRNPVHFSLDKCRSIG
jgi:hypothetical protein